MAGSNEQCEPFVDADEAARFLSITRRRVLELARAGRLPAHPIGPVGRGKRCTRRFRLSELTAALLDQNRLVFALRRGHSIVRPWAVTDNAKGE